MNSPTRETPSWEIFLGNNKPRADWEVPKPPPWRPRRASEAQAQAGDGVREPIAASTQARGEAYRSRSEDKELDKTLLVIRQLVNAALHLRRPLLVTGPPGSGKSSLIDAVAYELQLGEPLRWPVTSRSTLRDGLYTYDAIGRVQAEGGSVASHIRLGPLGTAMLPALRPRALLIDEIDKADVDLPNDLLNVIEEAYFDIPELARMKDERVATVRCFKEAGEVAIRDGKVESHEFPFVVMTSNGERDFPAPFLRRCLQIQMPDPCMDAARLRDIVKAHLGDALLKEGEALIKGFVDRSRDGQLLATDQLLNAILLTKGGYAMGDGERQALSDRLTEAIGRRGA